MSECKMLDCMNKAEFGRDVCFDHLSSPPKRCIHGDCKNDAIINDIVCFVHADEGPPPMQQRPSMLCSYDLCASPALGDGRCAKHGVTHPSHYMSHPSGVECIEITQGFNFNVGNAIKYLWRAGLKKEAGLSEKEARLKDLNKARQYIEFEIKRCGG